MKRIILILSLSLILILSPSAFASPSSPSNTRFFWDHDGLGSVAGFYFYYAPEAESPRVYSDARRVQLPGASIREIVILSSGIGDGRWCGRVTAYNADGDESAFSNEYCGRFFVLNPATGLGVE